MERIDATHPARRPSQWAPRKTRLALAVATAAAALLIAPSAALAAIPGEHRWADPVPSSDGDGEAVAVVTNAAGHPIVVGQVFSMASGRDILYRSYLPDGTVRWDGVPTTWDGSGDEDTAAGVVIDKARNCVYVAGTTESADGDTDLVILKLLDVGADGGPPGGSLIWAQTFDASPGGDEQAAAIARDKHGNVYVTGRSQRSDGSWDLLTVKYRSDGSRAWAKRHNNDGVRPDRGRAIAVRGDSVFVAGVSRRPVHGEDVVLIRYSLGGSRKWVRYHDDSRHGDAKVTAMALTSSSAYVCGYGRRTSANPGDALLLKYGHDGRKKWVRYTAGSGRRNDIWSDIAVDNKARVHLTGSFVRRGSGPDIVTRLYSSSGKRLWQRIFKTDESEWVSALAVDSSRRTYICGARDVGQLKERDAVVIKYGTGGATLWSSIYPDPVRYPGETDSGNDWANDVAVGGDNVYAAGHQTIDYGGRVAREFLALAVWR